MLTATTATAPFDTLNVPFLVIPRWQGRLVWDRSPADGVNSGIAILELPAHEVRQLPDLGYPGAGSGDPHLTSDGRYVAAIAPRPISPVANRTIYVVDLVSGAKAAPFDGLPGNQFSPVWFPGDTLLAFLTEAPTGYEVFTARPDGSELLQRTHLGQSAPPFFDVTPDGNLVLELQTGNNTTDLFETTLTGDTLLRLTTTPGYEGSAAVSPDGTTIAYSDGFHVWLRDRDGANPRRLLPHRRTLMGFAPNVFSALSGSPSWTIDSRFVLVDWYVDTFLRPDGQAYEVRGEIYAIRISDGLAVRLSRSFPLDAQPFFR